MPTRQGRGGGDAGSPRISTVLSGKWGVVGPNALHSDRPGDCVRDRCYFTSAFKESLVGRKRVWTWLSMVKKWVSPPPVRSRNSKKRGKKRLDLVSVHQMEKSVFSQGGRKQIARFWKKGESILTLLGRDLRECNSFYSRLPLERRLRK